MDEDLADFALDLAMGQQASFAEVRSEHHLINQLVMKNGVLDALLSAEDAGLCVKVVAKGGIGFASTNELTRPEVRRLVGLATKMARTARRKEPILFAEEPAVDTRWEVRQEIDLASVGPEQRIEELNEIDRSLTSLEVACPGRMLSTADERVDKYIVTSEGTRIRSKVPRLHIYAYLTVKDGVETQQAYRQYGGCGGWEVQSQWRVAEALSREAQVLGRLIREGKKSPEGKTTLICGPEVAGIAAHEACGHPTEADRILGREQSQAGGSFITQAMIGTRIGSPVVSIIDDPTIEHSYGYFPYDDEGVRARPRYLYKDGLVHGFLHNRETAARMGVRSNAASRSANYNREAIVRMSNTFVAPGDHSEEELFEDVKSGIYMKSFTEWNIDDKRYNEKYIGRESYLIEGGQLTTPLKRTIIETTTPGFWMAVDAVSRKVAYDAATCGKGDPMQGVPVFTGGPMVRLREVHLK